jgi:hypothetical protein
MKITFSSTHNAWSVKAPKGTLISLTEEPTVIKDGVYVVGDDGTYTIDDGVLTDSIYLSTAGSDYTAERGARVCYPAGIEIRAGSNVAPFIGMGSGSGSGGGEESGFEMPRLNVYGYNIIDGRTWQVLNNAYGGIRPTPAGQAGQSGWLTLDPTQSYEIGVAIKALTISGHLLVYSGDGARWMQAPFCEYADGQLIFYIDSNGGDPWDVKIIPMESDNWPAMQVDQWYFFKFAYDGNGKYTGAYTNDFATWYTFEKTSSITHYSFNTFGYSNGTLYSKTDIIYDIGNLYVKQNDQMVWGNYLGNFPDE